MLACCDYPFDTYCEGIFTDTGIRRVKEILIPSRWDTVPDHHLLYRAFSLQKAVLKARTRTYPNYDDDLRLEEGTQLAVYGEYTIGNIRWLLVIAGVVEGYPRNRIRYQVGWIPEYEVDKIYWLMQ
jgi:hypothetical protein